MSNWEKDMQNIKAKLQNEGCKNYRYNSIFDEHIEEEARKEMKSFAKELLNTFLTFTFGAALIWVIVCLLFCLGCGRTDVRQVEIDSKDIVEVDKKDCMHAGVYTVLHIPIENTCQNKDIQFEQYELDVTLDNLDCGDYSKTVGYQQYLYNSDYSNVTSTVTAHVREGWDFFMGTRVDNHDIKSANDPEYCKVRWTLTYQLRSLLVDEVL